MRIRFVNFTVVLSMLGSVAMAEGPSKPYPLDDYVLDTAKSEKEMISWALGKSTFVPHLARRDYAETRRFKVAGHDLVILLSSQLMATKRVLINVYVGDDKVGWELILHRYSNTAEVKIRANEKTNCLEFRSKADKLLLILPVENVELQPTRDEM